MARLGGARANARKGVSSAEGGAGAKFPGWEQTPEGREELRAGRAGLRRGRRDGVGSICLHPEGSRNGILGWKQESGQIC